MRKINLIKSFSFAFLFGCMIFSFSASLAAQDQSSSDKIDFSKAVYIEKLETVNLSPEEMLWVPSKVSDTIRKDLQSVLKARKISSTSDAPYVLKSVLTKSDAGYTVKVSFVDSQTGKVISEVTSKEYLNPASLYIKDGAVDSVFAEFVASDKTSTQIKKSSSSACHNEVIAGVGPMFAIENSTFDSSKYVSFCSAATVDLAYRFYPVSDVDFGIGLNVDASMPYFFRTWQDGVKTSVRLSNISLLGCYLDFALGCQYRHNFNKTHGLEWFAGPSLSLYAVNYEVGFDTTETKNLLNLMFGLQARISYVYNFTENVAITSGLFFEYDFYSLAQIKYPEDYTVYANFILAPVVSAKISF
ncbi:MAG: hypothetical protein K6G52_06055 [Treponemataceae bacterium]|nr:hypothetical protein [Treponemataceae bacterium]